MTVKQPERDIDSAQLLHSTVRGEGLRKQRSFLAVLFISLHGGVLIQLERNDILGSLRTRKLGRNDGRVAAVRTGGCGRGRLRQDLAAAARAGIGYHVRGILSPVRGNRGGIPFPANVDRVFLSGHLLRLGRLVIFDFLLSHILIRFIPVHLGDLIGGVYRKTVITLQFSLRRVKMERPSARRAFIIHCILCHILHLSLLRP